MKAEAKTAFRRLAVPAALLPALLLCGCVTGEIFQPGGLSGLMTPQNRQVKLAEPDFPPVAATYATEHAYLTMDAPVVLNAPDKGVVFAVVSKMNDLLGTPHIPGSFEGGAIVEREFRKFVEANFREPVGTESPVAKLSVRIQSVEVSQPSKNALVDATLRLTVEVDQPEGGETAYAQNIETTARAPWKDRSQVPDAFYQALFGAIAKFAADWDAGTGPATIARWAGAAAPGVVPPELHAIEWLPREGDVQRGRCTIACNGYEGFRARHWADAHIARACRTRLGNIELGRLRVVYDEEEFDPAAATWTFSFRTFVRNDKVLEFNAATGTGTVIGDLGLLNMGPEEAAEALRLYVTREMESHSGVVSGSRLRTEAYLRFDDFTTDKTYNLISIDFRLLQ